ncbi:MAG: putative sugar nucleotidyl transferase, partial [Candidatus Cloacimonadaceae bacterium]
MQLTIFDDIYYRAFYPLTFTRSIGDLRCGALKLRQRVEYLFGDEDSATSIFVEPRLKALYLERHPDWQVN